MENVSRREQAMALHKQGYNCAQSVVLAYEDIPAGYSFIQPCDTGFIKDNQKIMNRCVEFVKNHPNWRLSLQQQKILNVR